MKNLLKNAVGDLFTTLLGGMAGLPELIAGVQSKDAILICKGLGMLLLGLAVNNNKQ